MARLAPALLLLAACGASSSNRSSEVLAGLPARTDPALDLADDTDLERARGHFEALPLDAPERAASRKRLWEAYRIRVTRSLASDRERAFTVFATAIGMWDARELGATPAADLQLAVPLAEELYTLFGATGADLQAMTALAVLHAAQPDKRAEHEKRWREVVQVLDDMAVAERGEGAAGSRVIVVADQILHSFPSRWVADLLVELYEKRQQTLVDSIKNGQNQRVLGVHRDPGVARPVWSLVRVYGLTYRLDEAPAKVKPLTGQFGDEPELRRRLDAALAKESGEAWLALAAAYIGDEPDEGDRLAALAICTDGAARMPKAVEPRKCACEVARVTRQQPLAMHWAEEARKLAPKDKTTAELYARMLLIKLADEITGERLDQARATLGRAETFFAEATPLWGKEKPEITLADAYIIMGRGLLNLGEVPEARRMLERAEKLGASPDVTEQLATIAHKTGRHRDAARGFLVAAKAPRDTPLEQQFESARLHRLAGEASDAAGDKQEATAAWRRSLSTWEEILSAQLNNRARAEALEESGRVLYHLGNQKEALAAFAGAIDVDSEQESIYGDVISFLIVRGHYAESLDAYHRALARNEVTDYLKLYLSLWITDLARLRGLQPDGLATDFLGQMATRGQRWQNDLARFAIGDLDWKALYAKADTRGKRAEAFFYQAMRNYAAGDRAEAERRLRGVIASDMLGFFEFDMARYYLAHGPPRK